MHIFYYFPLPCLALIAKAAITSGPTVTPPIGINPIESDLGDAETYIGEIYDTDTKYIELQNSTTHWIGINSEYLTVTGTSTIQIVAATATIAVDGQSVGDVSVILLEGLAVAMQQSTSTAITVCKVLASKLRRRDFARSRRQVNEVLTCLIEAAVKATAEGGIFEGASIAEWASFTLRISESAAGALQSGIAAIGDLATKNKVIAWLAMAAISTKTVVEGTSQEGNTVAKINIPAGGFAAPLPTTGCDVSATRNIDSPLCGDSECQGVDEFCTVNPNIKCPCLDMIPDPKFPQFGNLSDFILQQSIFDEVNADSSSSTASIPTSCVSTDTLYPPSTVTQHICMCGRTIAAMNLAVSGTVTTSYCTLGSDPPTGFTQIPAVNGQPLTTPAPVTTPQTTVAPSLEPSTVSSTKMASTSKCDNAILTCGAPFCC